VVKKKSIKNTSVKAVSKIFEASDILFEKVIVPVAKTTMKGAIVGVKETIKVVFEADKMAKENRKKKKKES
jgi:hypothetical protein